MSPPFDLDALLAHADCVRRLSLQLCRDQHAAADAAQETWLRVVQNPPTACGSARGFLTTVLRNVVHLRGRAQRRSERREQAVAGRDLAESAADAAGRAELQQLVVREVLALPEPQRSLVLLHYFEGRAVEELARVHGLTADAVRSHLRRARDTLRARLRGHDGPARSAFAGLLFAGPQLPLWFAGMTLVICMKMKLLAAAAATALVALSVWQFAVPAASPKPSPDPATVTGAAAPVLANTTADAHVGVQRTAATLPEGAAPRIVRCQLTGLDPNAPWSTPIEVRLPGGDEQEMRQLLPDEHGAFAIATPDRAGDAFAARIGAADPNYQDFELTVELSPSRHAEAAYEIPVQPVAMIVGTVVDHHGEPVPCTRVSAFAWLDGKPREPRHAANTAADGSFVLKMPMATELFLVALAMHEDQGKKQVAGRHGAIPDSGEPRDDLLQTTARATCAFGARTDVGVLTLSQPAWITGELRDPQGRPVIGEFVHWCPSPQVTLELAWDLQFVGTTWQDLMLVPGAKTDENGRFRLAARTGTKGTLYFAQSYQRFEPFVGMRQVTAPADVPVQLAGNTVLLRVVRLGVPVQNAYLKHDGPFQVGSPLTTDERGEVRLLREHANVQQVSVRLQGQPSSVPVELPLDSAPDRPILVDLGDLLAVPVTFDVTSAIAVQQFAVLCRATGAKSSAGLTVARDVEGHYRCEIAPGDYEMSIGASNRAEGDDRFVMSRQLRVLVPPGGTRVPLTLQHGGRIRIQVRERGGVFVAGMLTLTGPDGQSQKPGLDRESGYYSRDGKLPGTGPVVTDAALAPGAWQVDLDLGPHGVHRRTVDVRACETAEVDLRLP
ncbi:MAG: RNA polymerase sigma factor [Planctomycetota bacterium]